MGRRAKATTFSAAQLELEQQAKLAAYRLAEHRKKRALEIGLLAIDKGLGDYSDKDLIKLFSQNADKDRKDAVTK